MGPHIPVWWYVLCDRQSLITAAGNTSRTEDRSSDEVFRPCYNGCQGAHMLDQWIISVQAITRCMSRACQQPGLATGTIPLPAPPRHAHRIVHMCCMRMCGPCTQLFGTMQLISTMAASRTHHMMHHISHGCSTHASRDTPHVSPDDVTHTPHMYHMSALMASHMHHLMDHMSALMASHMHHACICITRCTTCQPSGPGCVTYVSHMHHCHPYWHT